MNDKLSLLLVEDDRSIAMALKIRLQAHGYKVAMAENIEQAFGHAEKACPQLAVVDINLPDGNGISLVAALQTLWPGKSVPTLIMTASKRAGLCEMAMANGAVGFMEKPFRSDQLINKLQSISSSV
ncbi:MAG: response regulator [Granulosicoccus sp.]